MMLSITGLISTFCMGVAFLLFADCFDHTGSPTQPDKLKQQPSITILYDNYVHTSGLQSDWGFACIIKGFEKTILFDTGAKGEILLANMKKLQVDPTAIEIVLLSHEHLDHTGGLLPFLELNKKATVYPLGSFPASLLNSLKEKNIHYLPVSQPVEICKDVYSSGEMGKEIHEQALVLQIENELVIVTGCSHPGIAEMLTQIKQLHQKPIRMVLGGFHLLNKSEAETKQIIQQLTGLGIQKIAASHCTGASQIEIFRQELGDRFVSLGVGRVIQF